MVLKLYCRFRIKCVSGCARQGGETSAAQNTHGSLPTKRLWATLPALGQLSQPRGTLSASRHSLSLAALSHFTSYIFCLYARNCHASGLEKVCWGILGCTMCGTALRHRPGRWPIPPNSLRLVHLAWHRPLFNYYGSCRPLSSFAMNRSLPFLSLSLSLSISSPEGFAPLLKSLLRPSSHVNSVFTFLGDSILKGPPQV